MSTVKIIDPETVIAGLRERWAATSPGRIAAYLAKTADPLVHLGCGPFAIRGWLNTDLICHNPDVAFLDCLKPMPFKDGALAGLFSEHQFEHFSFTEGAGLLAE